MRNWLLALIGIIGITTAPGSAQTTAPSIPAAADYGSPPPQEPPHAGPHLVRGERSPDNTQKIGAVLETRPVLTGSNPTPAFAGQTRALYSKTRFAHGPDPRHRLDLFTSTGATALRSVLVFVHGGGFVSGNKSLARLPF